jgi:hypothetical protein
VLKAGTRIQSPSVPLHTSVVVTLRDGIEPVSPDFIGGGVPRSLEYEKESFSIKTRLELF